MRESHTATEQWQSFELRMRQRRLERCLVRAAAALDADVLDIATEALEEAQHLSPSDSRLPDLVYRLALAEALPAPIKQAPRLFAVVERSVVVVHRPARSRGWMWAGALMLIVMSAVAGWFAAVGRATLLQLASLKTRYVTDAQPARTSAPETTAASSSSSAALPVTERPRKPEPAPDKTATARPVEKPTATTARESTKTSAVKSKIDVAPTPPPLARPAPELRPEPAVTNKPAPLSSPVGSPVTVPSIANDAPSVQPAPTLPEPAASANDERLVRAVLTRYAAAYNGLDAAAARAVWPSVDQRALARAFDGLLSQSIALGHCDVRVNGTSARAECAGNATWTPKVGGGMQSASRRWRFDLRNTGGDWIIVQATVR